MRNYVSKGRTVPVLIDPAIREVHSGDPLRVGALFGIAATSVLKNDPRSPFGQNGQAREVELYVEGVVEIATDASQFATGDRVFFDPEKNVATATLPDPKKGEKSTFLIGVATQNIERSEPMIRVRLNGISL